MLRILPIFLVFAACRGGAGGAHTSADGALERTRIVWRQYKKGATIFIVENLGDRKLSELRSKRLQPGEVPVAYVPDEVMRKMLGEFRRFGYWDHAIPRPKNPIRVGGKEELTVIDDDRRMVTILRRLEQPGNELDAYQRCRDTFRAVWQFYPPRAQFTTGAENTFGVKKVEKAPR